MLRRTEIHPLSHSLQVGPLNSAISTKGKSNTVRDGESQGFLAGCDSTTDKNQKESSGHRAQKTHRLVRSGGRNFDFEAFTIDSSVSLSFSLAAAGISPFFLVRLEPLGHDEHQEENGEHQIELPSQRRGQPSSRAVHGTHSTCRVAGEGGRFGTHKAGLESPHSARRPVFTHLCQPPTVHPHARGERVKYAGWFEDACGPSPRPWGTRADVTPVTLHRRSIPTPVGNADKWGTVPSESTVHPHARGERCRSPGTRSSKLGPSPRPWGTPEMRVKPQIDARSIPTPVGNASPTQRAFYLTPVHPHARGERYRMSKHKFYAAGPSPRPWGTPLSRPRSRRMYRSIPTPVGNASSALRSWRSRSVHPHARGERDMDSANDRSHVGPSPRPWGTPRSG